MNLQEHIRKVLREENSDPIIAAIKRRVRDLEWFVWFEVREVNRQQIGGICSFKTPESFIEVIVERVSDGVYWDYFSTFFDDDSEEWAIMYKFLKKVINDNYYTELRDHFNITCEENNMNLQEHIRKVLREESKIPLHIKRRINDINRVVDAVLQHIHPCDYDSSNHFVEGVLDEVIYFLGEFKSFNGIELIEINDYIIEFMDDKLRDFFNEKCTD